MRERYTLSSMTANRSEVEQDKVDDWNEECDRYLARLPVSRVVDRMAAIAESSTGTLPVYRSGSYFYERVNALGERQIWRGSIANGDVTCVIAEGGSPLQSHERIDKWDISPDGNHIAVQLSVAGDELSSIYVYASDSGSCVDGPIGPTRYSSVAWMSDSQFVYTTAGGGGAVQSVVRHVLGAPPDSDVSLFVAKKPGVAQLFCHAIPGTSKLVVRERGGTAKADSLYELRVSGADVAYSVEVPHGLTGTIMPLVTRRGTLMVLAGSSEGYKALCIRPDGSRNYFAWMSRSRIQGITSVRDGESGRELFAALVETDGSQEIELRELADGSIVRREKLENVGYVSGMTVGGDQNDQLFLECSSTAVPTSIMRYRTGVGEWSRWSVAPQPRSWEPYDEVFELASNEDGACITIRITRRFDLAPTQCAPALVKVYNGFGIRTPPSYTEEADLWVGAGGIYIVIEVQRRTNILGEPPAARLRRTREDIADALSWLHERGTTAPESTILVGGSHGGMLSLSVGLSRPQLVGSIVALAPVTNMLDYEAQPFGPLWVEEFGPTEDPINRKELLSVSPLHLALAAHGRGPAFFLVAFEEDGRVSPRYIWEFAEVLKGMVGGTVLVRSVSAGHSGRDIGVSREVLASLLCFAGAQVGHDRSAVLLNNLAEGASYAKS